MKIDNSAYANFNITWLNLLTGWGFFFSRNDYLSISTKQILLMLFSLKFIKIIFTMNIHNIKI